MKKTLLIIFFITLSLFSCKSKEKFSKNEPKSIKVVTIHPQIKEIPDFIKITGKVKSKKIVYISPKIDGYIEKINVKTGDFVKANETIAIIKNDEVLNKFKSLKYKLKSLQMKKSEIDEMIKIYRKSLKQAKANLKLAKKNFIRIKNLLKSESATPQEFDKVQNAFINAKLEVNKAKDLLQVQKLRLKEISENIKSLKKQIDALKVIINYRFVKAPFDGIILEKYIEIGSLVKPGGKLFKLGSIKKVAILNVPVKYKKLIFIGKRVLIDNSKEKITEIIPESNFNSSQFKIKVSLKNSSKYINGEFIEAKLKIGMKSALILSKNYVKKLNDLYYVYICQNGYVVKTYIKGKPIYQNKFLVYSGINKADNVIISPLPPIISDLKCEE